MKFICDYIKRKKERKQKINFSCDQLIYWLDSFVDEIDSILNSKEKYVDPLEIFTYINRYNTLLRTSENSNIKHLKKAKNYKQLLKKKQNYIFRSQKIMERMHTHNDYISSLKIPEAYEILGNIEGRKLDTQQMACIVKEPVNHLVIAGAGTGKTTTIIGRIKYLLKTEKLDPKDILVLSFTNASASEMKERLSLETGKDIDVSTFHKLGKNIITKVEGVTPKITALESAKFRIFIKDQLKLNMKSEEYSELLKHYIIYNKVIQKSEFEFKSMEEYTEYLKLNPPVTIDKYNVKSYGEMEIANFLFENGIKYIYEQPYEMDTRTNKFGQYFPDFYLPDYKIYIEYFGIDRNGNVPSYFSSSNGMSPSDTYRNSMAWKQETHKKYGTKMISCYAYEKFDESLLDNLKKNLKKAGVPLNPKTPEEIWIEINQEEDTVLDNVAELFETLINLIKSNNYTVEDIRKKNSDANIKSNDLLLTLIEPIFNAYCNYLSKNNEIDFNDMINRASDYISKGKYIHPYKYVIVDEYQDISKARFVLLDTMRKSKAFNLFCVGDDWQSIYRFAGSDIDFILKFSEYWGPSEISKIETTYRFSQNMTEISGKFVMKNPAQIVKNINGKNDFGEYPLEEIIVYSDKQAITPIVEKLKLLPCNSSVYFIGRYSFDIRLLKETDAFEFKYNNITGLTDVKFKERKDLKISFLTAHKSKGLQADYVFIINNKNSRMGFPSKIQDAPIFKLLLENCDKFPYAEERRLFYVALTRARKKVFLLNVYECESIFISDLRAICGNQLKQYKKVCPVCGGFLIKRKGPYNLFWGCSNYNKTGCKYTQQIFIGNE